MMEDMSNYIEFLVANRGVKNTDPYIQFKMKEMFNYGLCNCFLKQFKNNTANKYSEVTYDPIATPFVLDLLTDCGFDVQGNFSIITKFDPKLWWKPLL